MSTRENQKNYAVPIAMMFLLFFTISFVTGLQNPLGVIVKSQFGLSNLQSQYGNFANFLAYLCMGIPAGKLLESIGYKKTALTSLIVGFTAILIMFLSSFLAGSGMLAFYIYLFGAFIGGFSMCMLNTVVNPMLTVLGSPEGANQRLNYGGAINSIGATLAPALGGALIGNIASARIENAKPIFYIAMVIFALVYVVLNLVKIPEPHIVKKEEAKIKDQNSALSFRHFKLGMVGIFIYVGIEVIFANITNLWLTAPTVPVAGQMAGLGYDTAIAGSIIAIYWLLMLVGRLLGGILGKMFTSKQMLIGVSALGLLLVALAIFLPHIMVKMPAVDITKFTGQIVEVPVGIVCLILGGFCTSVMWAGTFNLATAGLGKYTAKGSGLFMAMVVGGGVLPLVQGKVADIVGYQQSYWVLFACLIYMLYYALVGSRNVNTDIKVD